MLCNQVLCHTPPLKAGSFNYLLLFPQPVRHISCVITMEALAPTNSRRVGIGVFVLPTISRSKHLYHCTRSFIKKQHFTQLGGTKNRRAANHHYQAGQVVIIPFLFQVTLNQKNTCTHLQMFLIQKPSPCSLIKNLTSEHL